MPKSSVSYQIFGRVLVNRTPMLYWQYNKLLATKVRVYHVIVGHNYVMCYRHM